jgi:hypothetical protein
MRVLKPVGNISEGAGELAEVVDLVLRSKGRLGFWFRVSDLPYHLRQSFPLDVFH